MEATELRIGNHVKDPYNKTIKLTSVSPGDGGMLSPIKITKEWLIKFGIDNNLDLDEFPVWIEGGLGEIELYGGEKIKIELKYVHQLQNLYFALTGTELKQI